MVEVPMRSLLGVVLCGGKSSRMGRDKSTIRHADGRTFIEHAIARLQPLCNEVCIAGKAESQPNVPVLPDPAPHQGPIFGVLQAIEYAATRFTATGKHEACLITPVDMPYLTAEDLKKIISAWQLHDCLSCAICGPEQKRQPLVAIYPVKLGPAVASHAKSDSSLMRWTEVQRAIEVPLAESHCRNINRPIDLKQQDS